jgi:hypothetical protein
VKQYAALLIHSRDARIWHKPHQLFSYRIKERHDKGETFLELNNGRDITGGLLLGEHNGVSVSSLGDVVWEILDRQSYDTNSQFILWNASGYSKRFSAFSISHPRGISVTDILWGSESVLTIIFSIKYIFKLNIEKVRRCENTHIRLTWEDLAYFNGNPSTCQRFTIDNHGNLIQFMIRDLRHFGCLKQITMIKILSNKSSFVRL